MKLIEAMKLKKDLLHKAKDLREKIGRHCATLSFETPEYGDRQKRQVAEWLQAHLDLSKEIARLALAIQRTNLATKATIEIGGKSVEKPIAAWVLRRRELADLDRQAWASLTDRGLKEQAVRPSADGPVTEIKIVRHFDSEERDHKIELYRSEPGLIDRTLEVVNATTELITE